jgi:hypothetical protein
MVKFRQSSILNHIWSLHHACLDLISGITDNNLEFSRINSTIWSESFSAPLGPLTVAALLPEDWDIKFIDLNIREVIEEEWLWADIIMVSGMIVHNAQVSRKSFKKQRKGPNSPLPEVHIQHSCPMN